MAVATVSDGRVDYEALRMTGSGLRLIYVSMLLMVIIALGFVAGFVFNGKGLWLFALAAIAMLLVVSVLSLIGSLMCVTVPHESKGKGHIIASVVLQAINLLSRLAGTGFGFFPGFSPEASSVRW